jgi:hypothetical protein
MNENPNHPTPRTHRPRRKPGRATRASRQDDPSEYTREPEHQYDEHPQQAPSARHDPIFTMPRRKQASSSRSRRAIIARRTILMTFAICAATVCATVGLVAMTRDTASHPPQPVSPRGTATSSSPTISASAAHPYRARGHARRATTPVPAHPASRHIHEMSSQQPESSAQAPTGAPTSVAVPEPAPTPTNTAPEPQTPSEPQAAQPDAPITPPAHPAGEEQTGGGPFSP